MVFMTFQSGAHFLNSQVQGEFRDFVFRVKIKVRISLMFGIEFNKCGDR